MNQSVFVIAGFHVSNRLIQLRTEILTCNATVGGENFQYITIILQILPNGQSKSGYFALNEFATLLNKIENAVIGRKPQCYRQTNQDRNGQRHKRRHEQSAETNGARSDPCPCGIDFR